MTRINAKAGGTSQSGWTRIMAKWQTPKTNWLVVVRLCEGGRSAGQDRGLGEGRDGCDGHCVARVLAQEGSQRAIIWWIGSVTHSWHPKNVPPRKAPPVISLAKMFSVSQDANLKMQLTR